MGKHGDPNRHDTNPLRGIFRKTEPAHGFPLGQDPEPDNTGDSDRWEDPRDTFGGETDRDPDAVEHFDPITDTGTETTIFEYGRSPAYPEFQPDPEPFPSEPDDVEPPPDVSQADYEPTRRPRPWLAVLAVSGALSAVVLAGWLGRMTTPSEPVSDRYSAVQATVSVTVTATTGPKKSGAQPRPAVTVWRTRTPEPRVIVSRVPVPGPTVVTTRTAKPKPAPTVTKTVTKTRTITEQCTITITVRRDGTVISEESSGDC